MLFGIGEGLGFIFLNLSNLPLPFLGGRSKPFELTRRLTENLGLKLEVSETSSAPKAQRTLDDALANNQTANQSPVALQLDSYHLPYFTSKIHFAGHMVACLAREEGKGYLIADTLQQGGVHWVNAPLLAKARAEKEPMSARARAWTLSRPNDHYEFDLEAALTPAIGRTARRYLAPSFKGMSHLGIEKLAKSLPRWLDIATSPTDLVRSAMLMERGGTGGALFRRLYRDFLAEAFALKNEPVLEDAHRDFVLLVKQWSQLTELIATAGRENSVAALSDASRLAGDLAIQEPQALGRLSAL